MICTKADLTGCVGQIKLESFGLSIVAVVK